MDYRTINQAGEFSRVHIETQTVIIIIIVVVVIIVRSMTCDVT